MSVRDLSRGLIVDSGNDACVALADYIAGGQPQFVAMMNSYVKNSIYGIPILKPSTVWMRRDNIAPRMTAVLSRAIIHGEPEFYHMYSEKSLTGTASHSRTATACCGIRPCILMGLKPDTHRGRGLILSHRRWTGSVDLSPS